MIGSRFGPYEITARLGAGAMGEVYRATDTKLGRDVAIKVLPASFADDAERLTRFEREARMLASLDHPNVAVVHGLLEREGTRALVMELVEGPSLAARMGGDEKLPLDESLGIALQIAEAVEEAHEQGIVHRDLKPSNVLLTEDGVVKVVDFGLAKSLEGEEDGPIRRSAAPPAPAGFEGTQAGEVLGTAGYMSPEQAQGDPVDKRTDVWSFGVVLYEMLAGRRWIGGQSLPASAEEIFHWQTDLDEVPEATRSGLRRLLERCLERDPRQRLRDIGEARIELARALERLRDPEAGLETVLRAAREPVGATALGLSALLGFFVGWLLRGALSTRAERARVRLRRRPASPASRRRRA